jgi:hypothetical protein
MYLHKVRKSPLDGFNVNLSNSQMIVVVVLFLLFFVAPVIGINKLHPDSVGTNSNRVAGAQTSVFDSNKEKTQLSKITQIAAIGSSLMLVACLAITGGDLYKRNKTYEL